MKAIELQGSFGLENLVLTERDRPQPGPGEVLIEMRAASLNYRDLLMVRGHYNPKQPLPLIPCSDGVGVVVELGDGVTRVGVGDRVATLFSQDWFAGEPTLSKMRSTLGGPLDGTLAEYMVLSEEGVTPVAPHLSDTEAACLPCAALTAWSALMTHGGLTAGQTVLVLGTGGVSLFALQFAKLAGARVIVTSSQDEKLERALSLGADAGINYAENERWGREVLKKTDGRGVDLVVEVGGAGTLAQSLQAVRPGGQLSLIGVLSGVATELQLTSVLMQHVRIQGILVGHREGFEAMNRAIAQAELQPVVDRVFPLEGAADGLRRMSSAEHFGKIAVEISKR